MEMETTKLQKR